MVPGVGAFPRAMERLRALGLDRFLIERAGAEVPVLGICLGMQLFFEGSDELGGSEGMGWCRGRCACSRPGSSARRRSAGTRCAGSAPPPFLEGLGDRAAFYHVHSFVAVPDDDADVLGRAEYGERFASVVTHGSFLGAQFHPEKSSHDGLRLLANWVASVNGLTPAGGGEA